MIHAVPPANAPDRGAKTILAIMFASLILSYVDRAVFALTLKPLKAAVGLSDTQLGLLTGLAFASCYALFSPIAGWLGDRGSRKRVLVGAMAVWSTATVATAFAGDILGLFLVRGAVGAGEAAVLPLAVSLLSDTRPDPHARNRAFGVFISAGMFGQLGALLFGGLLIRALPAVGGLPPWREVFVLAGAMGFATILLIGLVMRDPPRRPPAERDGDVAEPGTAWSFLRAHPGLCVTLFVGLACLQLPAVASLGWIVAALGRAHDWSASESGVRFAATAGVTAIVGVLCMARGVRGLRARGRPAAPLWAAVASAVLFAGFTSAGLLVRGDGPALALVALGFLFALGPTASAFVVMGEAFPSRARTRLAGVNTLSNALICNTLGAYLVGAASDGLFRGKAGAAEALALVIVGATLVGAAVVLAGVRSYGRTVNGLAARSAGNAPEGRPQAGSLRMRTAAEGSSGETGCDMAADAKPVWVRPSGRPEIAQDAARVAETLSGGGIAIIPGTVGYGLMASGGVTMRRMFDTKQRARHKRHAMIGSWDLHRELHLMEPRAEEMVQAIAHDADLPLGVIGRYRPDHPILNGLDAETIEASSVEGTMSMLLNAGRFMDALIPMTHARNVPVMGSSANLTGTGTKFRIDDIQPEIIGIADVVVDYGLCRYHHYRRSSTLIDFTRLEVVRIGACYDLIKDLLARYFRVELPPDPGVEALPSGHLREPTATAS